MKHTEIEYQKRLSKFKKHKRNGVDIAFRCDKCSKIVVQSDVLYGVGCRKCGSNKVCPITESLTLFGLKWCKFWSWWHERAYIKKFGAIKEV